MHVQGQEIILWHVPVLYVIPKYCLEKKIYITEIVIFKMNKQLSQIASEQIILPSLLSNL